MKNAHLRFGWLTYYRRTEKTTTHFKVRLDRFLGERDAEACGRARAHFISVVGSDTQIAAVNAAISMNEEFTIEEAGGDATRAGLGAKAQTYRGSVQLDGRKKPLRHLIGVSHEFMTAFGTTNPYRTLVIDSNPLFLWSSLVRIHGLPAAPEWARWFCQQLDLHRAISPVLGIGCRPVLIRGTKREFLKWLGRGIERGAIAFPCRTGPILWPTLTLKEAFSLTPESGRSS